MTEESISHIALGHTKNIRLLFAQLTDFQSVMVDHMRVYQELLRLSCEIVSTCYQRHPNDKQVKRWMATANLLTSNAPFHEEKGNYAELIKKTHQRASEALSRQLKKPR